MILCNALFDQKLFRAGLSLALCCLLIGQECYALAPPSSFPSGPAVANFNYPDTAVISAAKELIEMIRADRARGKQTVLGLSAGHAARLFYREFYALAKAERPDFLANVNFFLLDEYDLPPKHPRSFRTFLNGALFEPFKIPEKNIHALSAYDAAKGERFTDDTLAEHLRDFQKQIQEAGGIDVAIVGLGTQGEIAFNPPGDVGALPAREVVLSRETRESRKEHFGDRMENVPERALTAGIEVLLRAKKLMLLALGEARKSPLSEMLEENSSPLLAHEGLTLYCDRNAMPMELTFAGKYRQAAYRRAVSLGFSFLYFTNKMRFFFLPIAGVVAYLVRPALLVPFFSGTVLFAGGTFSLWLLWHNYWLYRRNPFRDLAPRQSRVEGELRYEVQEDGKGNKFHIAIPDRPLDKSRPMIVFDHGREFELFTGSKSKINAFFYFLSRSDYDVRSFWGDTKQPESSFLSRIAKGHYLRPGKSVGDLSPLMSTDYADLARWPFFYLTRLKTLSEQLLARIPEMVAGKKIIPDAGFDEMVAVGSSTGARIRFIGAIKEHLKKDKDTGTWSLDNAKDPRMRGMIFVNAFFHPSREGNRWMRLQRKWFWDPLARYWGDKKTAYDEIDRAGDLSKIHERARLAAQHKDWPQVVWINTRMADSRLEPAPWAEYREKLNSAAGFSKASLLWDALCDLARRARVKWSAVLERGNIPFYYWVGSMFMDFRDTDGAVDSNLATGLDYYGKALDPDSISIVVDGIPHDCLDNELMQRLSFQLADLITDRVDLRNAVLTVTRKGAPVEEIKLAGRNPENPIRLNAKDITGLQLYVQQAKEPVRPEIEKMLMDQMLREGELPFSVKGWNSQPGESLRYLELFKGAVTRNAWPLTADVDALFTPGPPADVQEILDMLELLGAGEWVTATILMEVWLARGLLGETLVPEDEDHESWQRTLTSVRRRIEDRSKSRYAANQFSLMDLMEFQVEDRKFHKASRSLAAGMENPAAFSEVFRKIRRVWTGLGQDESTRKWIDSRENDFVQWVGSSGQAQSQAKQLLGIEREPGSRELWDQFLNGKKSAREVYRYFSGEMPGRILQMLVTLDLKIPLGQFQQSEALRMRLEPQPVDTAA